MCIIPTATPARMSPGRHCFQLVLKIEITKTEFKRTHQQLVCVETVNCQILSYKLFALKKPSFQFETLLTVEKCHLYFFKCRMKGKKLSSQNPMDCIRGLLKASFIF